MSGPGSCADAGFRPGPPVCALGWRSLGLGGAPVRLSIDESQEEVDRYDRLLRYITETAGTDGDVSVQQARAGMARYYDTVSTRPRVLGPVSGGFLQSSSR